MDNVLVDFKSGLDRVPPEIKAQYENDGTGKPHHDDIPGLFSLMDPMPGAIEAVKAIAASGKYEMYILSTAPWGNPSSWSDKLLWVKKHLDSDKPDGVFYKRIVLSHHKNLCAQENAWLRDQLEQARCANSNYMQSQYILGQIGRWYSNPPCAGPCGGCNNF